VQPITQPARPAVSARPVTIPARSRKAPPGRSELLARIGWFALYATLIVGSVVFLYPFIWMIITSLRTNNQVATSGFSIIPHGLHWNNYSTALATFDFWRYLFNSLLTTLVPIVGTVVSSSLAGFAFARMGGVRWQRLLFAIVIGTMLFPGEVVLIPQFVLFKQLGMIDTLYPLILPSFFASPFFIFLYRQYFARMPESLTEAATLDGLGWFNIWRKIYSPLARPVTAGVAVILFMSYWNNFMGPEIYVNSDKWKTLPLALSGFTQTNGTDTVHLMAATVVVTLPCVVLFFLAQKVFMGGVSYAGTDK